MARRMILDTTLPYRQEAKRRFERLNAQTHSAKDQEETLTFPVMSG